MLGRTNAGGGGGTALNFKVVRYASEADLPESAKENTIALFTNVDITGWYFSHTQPENMKQGEVWFSTGVSSRVVFNALKKNSIELSPSNAKQYVDGALVDVTAKTYLDNKWVDWIFYYFLAGNGLAEGYTGFSREYQSTNELIIPQIWIGKASSSAASVSNETIDVTDYSTLTIHIVNVGVGGNNDKKSSSAYFRLLKNGSVVSSVALGTTTSTDVYLVEDKTITFDLSSITGEIQLEAYGTAASTNYDTEFRVRIDSILFK